MSVGILPRYAGEVASESEPEGAARSMASRSPAPSTMLLMVPLPRGRGKIHMEAAAQRIVGMMYSAPARMPVGQRAVTVFSRV